MTTTDTTLALDEIRREGLEALRHELGLVGMVRFIQLFYKGSGDYTAERAKLQAGLTMDDAIASIERLRAEKEHAPKSRPRRAGVPAISPDAREDELRAAGLEALRRELGPTAFVLFLRQWTTPSGDYTVERAKLVGHLTVDEICDAIEKRRAAELEPNPGT